MQHAEAHNWYIVYNYNGDYILVCDTIGHPKLGDAPSAVTTPIQWYDPDNNSVHTMNTIYKLFDTDKDYEINPDLLQEIPVLKFEPFESGRV